ncbi:MAG: M23 family metallopeptidase [Bdellovibrionaceae bacterium]|nr:M23 family metallopeptidase [Pseudobdellovibrionaceae bacterium]
MNLKVSLIKSLFLCLAVAGCNNKKDKTTKDHSPPELLAPFVDTDLTEEFLAFGYELMSTQLSPAYEIIVSGTTAQVFSASNGVVTRVEFNGGGPGQNDYEIFVRPKKNSVYLLIYDHVDNVAVNVGDTVVPGTILGTVGDYGGGQGRIELQINNDSTDLAECPEDFGNTAFNDSIDMARHLNNAGYTVGDPRYFESACLVPTVQP